MRFMTYSHDTCGLGHLRRTFVISRQLATQIPDAMVLSLMSSNMGQLYFEPESRNHDYIKLPSVRKTGEHDYEARHLPISLDELIAMRRGMIARSIETFRPDVIIVDKNPQGLEGELIDPLESLRRSNPQARIVLGLRDVLDEPRITCREWSDPQFAAWIGRIYDHVWIWGDPLIYDAVSEYQFPDPIRKLTSYMGYLPPIFNDSNPASLRGKAGINHAHEKLLLVTAGGGGDAREVFLQAIAGVEAAGLSDVHTLLVAGPLMSESDYQDVKHASRVLGSRVRVVRFLRNFEDWMRAADAIISMGGYNTLSEAASMGHPTLVMPRTWPRAEQSIRATRFAEHGLCLVVPAEGDPVDAVCAFCRDTLGSSLTHVTAQLACEGLHNLVRCVDKWNTASAPPRVLDMHACEG